MRIVSIPLRLFALAVNSAWRYTAVFNAGTYRHFYYRGVFDTGIPRIPTTKRSEGCRLAGATVSVDGKVCPRAPAPSDRHLTLGKHRIAPAPAAESN